MQKISTSRLNELGFKLPLRFRVILLIACLISTSAQAQQFFDLPAGSVAVDLSEDGSTVVGRSGGQAFRWRIGGSLEVLQATPPYRAPAATAVSADGSMVFGTVTEASLNGSETFLAKWTGAGFHDPLTPIVDLLAPIYHEPFSIRSVTA
ncbi:MAG: hypothetical protein J0M12_17790, partial [Deltaproteobacteria bacterium]|nr:hypothetical protein [Deltaproteobacteria bacterium]